MGWVLGLAAPIRVANGSSFAARELELELREGPGGVIGLNPGADALL
jgi:hypothetical protein